MNNKSVKGTYSTMLPGFPYLHIFMYISVSVPLLVSCPPFTLPPIFFQVCFSFSFQGISEGVSITWRHATLCTRTHTHKPIIFLIPLDKTLQLWKDYEDITHSKLVEKVPLCHSSKRESCCGDLARCLAKHAEVSQACPAVIHSFTQTHTQQDNWKVPEVHKQHFWLYYKVRTHFNLEFFILFFVLDVQCQSFQWLAVVCGPWGCHSLTNT